MTKQLDDATPEEWDETYKKWVKGTRGDLDDSPVAENKPSNLRFDPADGNNIHSPKHYNQGQIECIEGIEGMLSVEEYIGYLRGNSMKYRWRFRYKNGFEDLSKAQWYEARLVKFMEDHDVLGQKER
jgi:hypothetical protein